MTRPDVPAATVRRRIEYSDVDSSGRYHYSTALRLFEAAETDLLERIGQLESTYNSMPRAKITFEYRETLYFRDAVDATVSVARLGRTSITFRFELHRASDGVLCVEGELVAVRMSDEGRPEPWTAEQRAAFDPSGKVSA